MSFEHLMGLPVDEPEEETDEAVIAEFVSAAKGLQIASLEMSLIDSHNAKMEAVRRSQDAEKRAIASNKVLMAIADMIDKDPVNASWGTVRSMISSHFKKGINE